MKKLSATKIRKAKQELKENNKFNVFPSVEPSTIQESEEQEQNVLKTSLIEVNIKSNVKCSLK